MRIKTTKKTNLIVICSTVLAIVVMLLIVAFIMSERGSAPKAKNHQPKKVLKEQPQSFDKTRFSTTDPTSPWIVVNKPHPLSPTSFVPNDLVAVGGQQVSAKAAADLQKLITLAGTQNIQLRVISGFRSYGYQSSLYNSYVARSGQAVADTYSARPGHSEHQTGLAADIGGVHGCDVEQCFGSTTEGKWLSENAGQYGFIIRYTEAKQSVTGYQAEPWHLRYVGVDLVNEMKKQGVFTLEEFFDITGGTTYSN